MDAEGYPDERELNTITQWDAKKDPFGLIEFVKSLWHFQSWGIVEKWGKGNYNKHQLFLQLHTGGWSGNESVIRALLGNRWFSITGSYVMWKKGGHYYFEIAPEKYGYKTVSDFSKEQGITRQAIHTHWKDKLDWINVSPKINYVRLK